VANIWIKQKLIDEILADIEDYSPLETGGAFFGYHSKSSDVVITHLIPAGPNAKHKRYSFEPDQEFQLKLMEELYYEKNASVSYLGDWHSHPTNVSNLSRRDERTLLNIALSASAQCQHPIMMIFGSCPEKWTINTVKFTEGKRYFWPLYKCNYETMTLIVD
jgi:integrative and conjugative element protein (TIGR02256 family)